MKKVAVYARVSTNKKEQELSFENQQKYFKSILNEENGYELVNIYADKGLSGTKFRKREAFNQMLYDAGLNMVNNSLNNNEKRNKFISTDYILSDRKPLFDLIFVKDSSRFARNTEVNRILNRLRDKGVYVFFEDLNKSTENEADRLIIDFLFGMAYQESVDKSNKTKFGMKRSSENGKVRCGNQLYGYKFNINDNTLRIIPEEAKVIKLIFDLRLKGYGSRRIARYLNEHGYKTRNNRTYGISRIRSILINPTYMGKQVYNRFENVNLGDSSYKKHNDINDWIIQDTDKVDQIIDEETFYKVQELIKENTYGEKGVYNGTSDFCNILYCSKCGAKYYKTYGRNKKVYYRCKNKVVLKNDKCDNRNVKEEEIYKAINDYIDQGVYNTGNILLIDFCIKIIEKIAEEKTNNADIIKIKQQIKEKQDMMEQLLNNMLTNSTESLKNVFMKKQEEINNELEVLENELKSITVNNNIYADKLNRLYELRKKLNTELKDIEDELTVEGIIKNPLTRIKVTEDSLEVNTAKDVLISEFYKTANLNEYEVYKIYNEYMNNLNIDEITETISIIQGKKDFNLENGLAKQIIMSII